VAARWAADDHTLLQPAEPCWLWPLTTVGNMLKQTVAKKELELYGGPLSRMHRRWSCEMADRARELTVTRRLRAGSVLLVALAPRRAPYSRAAPRIRPPRMSRRSSKSTSVASPQSTVGPSHVCLSLTYIHVQPSTRSSNAGCLQLVSSQLC
jgi:hypothetical protein